MTGDGRAGQSRAGQSREGQGRVVVVGSLNVDLITAVRRHPQPGETVLGGDLVRRRGGKGANQALAAARAGARVAIVGRVGDDADATAYAKALTDAGIDVSHLSRTPGAPTGTALIVVDESGENSIVVAPGANARLTGDDVRAARPLLLDADVVLVQLEINDDAVDAVFEIAAAAGVRVVLNASPVREVSDAWLARADPVLVNEHEAQELDTPSRRAASWCTTLGSRGARWGETVVGAPRVDPVDTTGAGDAFAGALAAALAGGGSRDVALQAAVAAGAEATTWAGAQP